MQSGMKRCLKCGLVKAEADFYKLKQGGLQTRCKGCHNAACKARKASDAGYRQRQYLAKKRWEARNPKRVRAHQGKLLFSEAHPVLLQEVESALISLRQLVWQQMVKPL